MVAHEPARLVGADRQDREPERAVAVARVAEMMAVAIARIRHVIDAPGRRLDHERGPQRLVAIGQPARRPVTRRHQRDGDVRGRDRRDGASRRPRRGSPESWFLMMVSLPSGVITRGRCAACEPRQRLDVEMIVVAMRDQHDVDRRQRVERDARIVDALRPERSSPARRAATTPDRSGCSALRSAAASWRGRQRRCAIPAHRRAPAAGRCRGSAPIRAILPVAVRDTSAAAIGEALRRRAVRVEEAHAVEMVRDRAVVVARRGGAQAENAGDCAERGKSGEQAAAGEEGHGVTQDPRQGLQATLVHCAPQLPAHRPKWRAQYLRAAPAPDRPRRRTSGGASAQAQRHRHPAASARGVSPSAPASQLQSRFAARSTFLVVRRPA